jgi:hypothetical protein
MSDGRGAGWRGDRSAGQGLCGWEAAACLSCDELGGQNDRLVGDVIASNHLFE